MLVSVSVGADPLVGLLRVSDVTEGRALALTPSSFAVTLEVEETESFAQGQLRSADDGATFAIRAPRALFERIEPYVQTVEANGEATE